MEKKKEKIGIALLTYNREQMAQKTFASIVENLPHEYDFEVCIVNDGTPYGFNTFAGYPFQFEYIQHKENKGIGAAKNTALKYLLSKDCDYYVLIEDDIIVKRRAFEKYIETIKVTGLQHLMFSQHGPSCKVNGKPNPRLIVNYTPEIGIALYPNCVGCFLVYTKDILQKVGLFDEKFLNAAEHLSHSFEISKVDGTSAWWWFADITDSWKYLEEQACSEVSSVIRPRADWRGNISRGWEYFKQKHGYYPTEIPDTRQEDVIGFLKRIRPSLTNET